MERKTLCSMLKCIKTNREVEFDIGWTLAIGFCHDASILASISYVLRYMRYLRSLLSPPTITIAESRLTS